MKTAVVGITGASGSVYAVKFVKQLLKRGWFVHLVCTDEGRKVMAYEMELDAEKWAEKLKAKYRTIELADESDPFSQVVAEPCRFDAVVILPCAMSKLAAIACGTGEDLVCRAADMAMKEGRKLLLVPRETPLSAVHLENMLKLSRLGVGMLPASPSFANRPETVMEAVNTVVGKALDWIGIENDLNDKWEE